MTTDDGIGVDLHLALYGNSDQDLPILAYGNTILDARFVSPSLRQSLGITRANFSPYEKHLIRYWKSRHNMKMLIALIFTLTVFNAYAVTLAWDAPNGTDPIVRYNLYVGTVSGQYSAPMPLGNVVTTTVNLPAGSYYAVVTAVDTANRESVFSNEVSFTLPVPALTATLVPQAAQGYVNPDYSDPGHQNVSVTYTLTDGGLPSQATVALNGSGTVNARVSWPAPGATQWSTVTANGQVLAEGSQWVPWGSPTVIVILSYPFTSSPTTFTVF
jgi:hypothetical protein